MSTRNPLPPDAPDDTLREARLLARYLVPEAPPRAVERLADALRRRPEAAAPSAAWEAGLRRPALLGPLDAATALLRPDDPLRRRLIIAAAILETEPALAPRFLPPESPGRLRALLTVAACGLRAACRLATGVPILLWCARR